MTKLLLILPIALCVHVCCAQRALASMPEVVVQIPGQIMYNDSSVVNTTIEIITVRRGFSAEYLQNKVHYIDENGKRKKVRPKDALEVSFVRDEQMIRMISRRAIHHTHKKKFMHLLVNGKVRLYEYIKTDRYSGRQQMYYAQVRTSVYWYLENDDGKFITPHAIGFRKQMKRFFTGCEKLTDRIEGKVYKLWEVPDIVRYYNQECL